ncbi:MAG: hypothetical protein GY805_06110 [Chloroflexi bacterium]|nr:hypothetical protein [Chloroflexota bacterium]
MNGRYMVLWPRAAYTGIVVDCGWRVGAGGRVGDVEAVAEVEWMDV